MTEDIQNPGLETAAELTANGSGANTGAETWAETEAKTEAGSGPDTKAGTKTDTGAGAEAVTTAPESEARTDSRTDTDDNGLALKAMSGDTRAFSSLAARYTGQLRLYIQTICPNPTDAEDICQESLRKAYQNIGTFNPEYLFRSWIFSIARNTTIDHIRRRNNFTTVKLTETDEPVTDGHETESSPEEHMIDDQSYDLFIRTIAALPDRYRRIAELRLLHDLSYQDIADETGLPLNTVRTRIRRAKHLIEQMMNR